MELVASVGRTPTIAGFGRAGESTTDEPRITAARPYAMKTDRQRGLGVVGLGFGAGRHSKILLPL